MNYFLQGEEVQNEDAKYIVHSMVIILLLNVTDNREVLDNFKRRKKQEREWRDILRRCCQVREGRLIFE